MAMHNSKLPSGFSGRIRALLTGNIIFEVQFFVGGLVVKIPACV